MMRLRGPGTAVLAATALAALVLTGCQSEESPTASPSPSASSASPSPSATTASPTPSASPTSEIPAAARKKTDAGAEAFVKYFVEQSSLAWTTPDPEFILRLSAPGCDSCSSLAKTAKDLRNERHRYAKSPISVVSVEALAGDTSRLNVAATIHQVEVDVIDESGKVVSSDREDDLERTFLLYWGEGAWTVGGIA